MWWSGGVDVIWFSLDMVMVFNLVCKVELLGVNLYFLSLVMLVVYVLVLSYGD